ncbi:hypothetical protein HAX54_039550 [Datura stramonium]|uniref:Uncharacterized protein n=1 Tax=Datura stramonium TaxID=4076 RepID=A0ABS8RMZ8_DATST|nr:hypothetical protein [Datura stramonium]
MLLIRRLPFDNEELIQVTHCVSAIITGTSIEKKWDRGALIVPYRVGSYDCYVITGQVNATYKFGVLDNVVDVEVPILLELPFLATDRDLMDLELNNHEIIFKVDKRMKFP